MLTTMLIGCECYGLISISVIYHTVCLFWASQMVRHRLILIAILLELVMAFIVSTPYSPRQSIGKQYRPQASHSLMLIFLVPVCVLKDTSTVMVNSDVQGAEDILWLTLAHLSVIMAKFASSHGRHPFLAYGLVAFMAVCLVAHISLPSYLIFFMASALFSWKCIDVIPSVFPKSFSFGEMAVVIQLSYSWLVLMVHSLQGNLVFDESVRLKWTGSTIVGAVIIATLVLIISKGYRFLFTCALIYTVHAGCSIALLSWMFQENFIFWLFNHLFKDCTGITLIVLWILLFSVTIVWTVSQVLVISSSGSQTQQGQYTPTSESSPSHTNDYQIRDDHLSRDSLTAQRTSDHSVSNSSISYKTRKVFHLFILLVYIPGLLLDYQILFSASCAAFGAFIIFEAIRVLHVPVIGQLTDYILRPFTDERDQGSLFLTHIYLLGGLSLPLWITSSPFTEWSSPLKFYSGVLALGIGDTVACLAGTAYGKHRWPGTKKTVEGSLAAFAAQLIFVLLLVFCDLLTVHSCMNLCVGVMITVLIEAFTDQIDNLVLPLVLFPFLC